MSLALWLYSCIAHALDKLSKSKSNSSNPNANQYGHHHTSSTHNFSSSSGSSSSSLANLGTPLGEYASILEKTCDILSFISSSPFLKAIFHVGKSDDQVTYSKLLSKISEVEKLLSTGYPPSCLSSLNNSKELFDTILNFRKVMEWNNRDPIHIAIDSLKARRAASGCSNFPFAKSVAQTFNAIIAINAILNPTEDIDTFTRQIILAARLNDIPVSEVCCEVIRSCFIELANQSGTEGKSGGDMRWASFTFLKLPQFFSRLSVHLSENSGNNEKKINGDLEKGIEKLLVYSPLLDLTDLKINCDCLELFLKRLMQNGFTEAQKNRIMCKRFEDYHSRSRKKPSTEEGTGLILCTEPTATILFKTLDGDYSQTPEDLLSVLGKMVVKNALDAILNYAAAIGKLQSFTNKLILFNEFNKETSGEGGKASYFRTLLFDITFLLLCKIAQDWGTEIILNNSEPKDSFFATWCARTLPGRDHYNLPEAILSKSDPIHVEKLLSQLSSPNYKFITSLVKWNEVCNNVPAVVKEILVAWEVGALSADSVKQILDNLASKMCCLSVSASAWLCSYMSTLSPKEWEKPMTMLRQLMVPNNSQNTVPSSTDDFSNSNGPPQVNQPEQDDFYKDRSAFMSDIVKKMLKDLDPSSSDLTINVLSPISHSEETLWKILEDVFFKTHSRSWLDQAGIRTLDTLLAVGGPNWFVGALIRLLFRFDHAIDLSRAVSLIFGLLHLEIQQCSLCLLVNILPGYLLKSNQQEVLVEPKTTALARLTVMTIFAALNESEERKAGRARVQKKYGFCGEVPLDYNISNGENKFHTNHSGEPRPSKMMRRSDSDSVLNSILDDTPFMLAFNNQQSPMNDANILDDPLYRAIADLFKLFTTIIGDYLISQRTLFPLIFLEQLILCGKQNSNKVLQFLPFQTIISLVKIMPASISYEFILAVSLMQTPKARKIVARALCQLRRAKNDGPKTNF